MRSVAVTADGAAAVSGGDDRAVRAWDLATGKQIVRWSGDYPITGIALSRQPLTMVIGERRGQPYLLKFRS